MIQFHTRLVPLWIVAAAMCGCADKAGPSTPMTGPVANGPTTKPNSPMLVKADARQPVVHLDVYQVTVPMGAVSRNGGFWKRVDEERVDPATYDVLLKNGVRVGIAPTAEWDYFKDILDRYNARAVWGSVMAGGAGSLELSMKKNVVTQDIFYLSDRNELVGKTYEKCENLLGVSFWPEPRTVGAMQINVSPTVRATRSRWEFKQNGEEREIVEVRPEYLYDLNLRMVIPPDSFLVLAPSQLGRWPTSLGNAFLSIDTPAEQREQVLVFVPKTVKRGDPMIAIPPPVQR